MKNKLIFIMIASCSILSHIGNAQKVESFQAQKVYSTKYGTVSGTEKYSYSVDERGKNCLQGNYSFSGTNEYGNSTAQIKNTFSVNATCKDNHIHGSYVSKENVVGKQYIPFQGWKTATSSISFSGIFTNGKPNGNFQIIINDDYIAKGSATLKNGQYIGSYNYENLGTKISGLLTENGKLTGTWTYKDPLNTTKYVFDNDVLINETSEGVSTPPATQQIARQLATGKLSKQQVENKGFIVKTGYLPLDKLIDDLFLREETTGLQEFPGSWDFSEYKEKSYTYIIQLNILTNEGLKIVLNELRERPVLAKENTSRVYGANGSWCSSYWIYDNSYDKYYLDCGNEFYSLYGSNGSSSFLYLTDSQFSELKNLQDSILINDAIDFAYLFSNNMKGFRNDDKKEISSLGEMYISFRNDSQNLINTLPFDKNKIKSYLEKSESTFSFDTSSIATDIRKNLDEQYSWDYSNFKRYNVRYTTDSAYIIVPGYIERYAWKNEFDVWDRFNKALLDAYNKAENLEKKINEYKNLTPNTKIKSYLIKHCINNISPDSYSKTSEKVIETSALLEQLDTIESNHIYIVANIAKKETKDYQKVYKQISMIKPNGNDIDIEQCKSLFNEVQNSQEKLKKGN